MTEQKWIEPKETTPNLCQRKKATIALIIVEIVLKIAIYAIGVKIFATHLANMSAAYTVGERDQLTHFQVFGGVNISFIRVYFFSLIYSKLAFVFTVISLYFYLILFGRKNKGPFFLTFNAGMSLGTLGEYFIVTWSCSFFCFCRNLIDELFFGLHYRKHKDSAKK